jgi:nucleotide-binding universal stress UspA family protein
MAEQRRALEQTLASLLAKTGVLGQTVIAEGSPAVEIVRAAQRLGTRLLVVATHGSTGLRHLALGSVAERVIRSAPCSVLVERAR